MEKILEFLENSNQKELKWKCLIRLIFSKHLPEKEKIKILETFTLTLIVLTLLPPLVHATPTLVTIQDQQGRTITQLVKISVVGCTVKAYNSSHFILEIEESCILKVYLYNITVWQGSLEPNRTYIVKVSVVEMRIKSPSRDIPIVVKLVGSNKEWLLYGGKEYTIYPVPAATYNISLPSKSFTIYYNGGELRVVKDFSASPQLPLLALAVIPLASYGGYKAFKQSGSLLLAKYRLGKRRRKQKPRIKHSMKHVLKPMMEHLEKPVLEYVEESKSKPRVRHKWKPAVEPKKKVERKGVSLATGEGADIKKRREEKPPSGFWAKLTGKEEEESRLKSPLKYRTLADLLEVVE